MGAGDNTSDRGPDWGWLGLIGLVGLGGLIRQNRTNRYDRGINRGVGTAD
jgi:MYXO-CTERM domain-containing protein